MGLTWWHTSAVRPFTVERALLYANRLVFGNADDSAIGLPHLTGEKWSLVDEDVMIAQRCGSCNYGGDTLIELYVGRKNTNMILF